MSAYSNLMEINKNWIHPLCDSSSFSDENDYPDKPDYTIENHLYYYELWQIFPWC